MADIKQAAKWLQEGKRVCRPEEHMHADFFWMNIRKQWVAIQDAQLQNPDDSDDGDEYPFSKYHTGFAIFTAEDLLADDWEIAN